MLIPALTSAGLRAVPWSRNIVVRVAANEDDRPGFRQHDCFKGELLVVREVVQPILSKFPDAGFDA